MSTHSGHSWVPPTSTDRLRQAFIDLQSQRTASGRLQKSFFYSPQRWRRRVLDFSPECLLPSHSQAARTETSDHSTMTFGSHRTPNALGLGGPNSNKSLLRNGSDVRPHKLSVSSSASGSEVTVGGGGSFSLGPARSGQETRNRINSYVRASTIGGVSGKGRMGDLKASVRGPWGSNHSFEKGVKAVRTTLLISKSLSTSSRGRLESHLSDMVPAARELRRRRKGRPDLGRKFRAAAWISIIIKRLCSAHLRNSSDTNSPYMKNIQFVEKLEKEKGKIELMFDVDNFKANREMRLSEDCKRILATPTWARTSQDILHVEIILRTIEEYADYPGHIQNKVAKVGEYRKYNPRRVIIREGHIACNFYIILSGSVLLITMDESRDFVAPKTVLKRGQSFGEVGIIQNSRRNATVIALEETELLCVWHEDYNLIFMNGGVKKSEDKFLLTLPFLKGWPLELADECPPSMFKYYFYKRGEIVIKDSQVNKWIVLVKSGSMDVLKKLRKVEAFQWRKKQRLMADKETWTALKSPVYSLDPMVALPNRESESTASGLTPQSSVDEEEDVQRVTTVGTLGINLIEKPVGAGTRSRPVEGTGDDSSCGQSEQTVQQIQQQKIEKNPMFVHVQTVTKGQVFGLYEVVLGPQPSFCLVSNGAETVMINKEFFNEHLGDETRKAIDSQARAYPTDEEMQENLQVAVDWKAFRALTLKSAVRRSSRKAAARIATAK